MTDRELVARALAGDQDSLREIFERTQSKCFQTALRYTNGCPFEAKDLMQKTYCRVFDNLDTFEEPYCLAAWVISIVRNLGLNQLRDRARERTGIERYGLERRHWSASPEEDLLAKERRRLVRQAMDRESNIELRETARLFYEEGRPVEEIARALGLTVTAVTTRLGRFRGRMRKRLLKMKFDGNGG